MASFLIIDTSSKNLSLSIINNDTIINTYYGNQEMSHAKEITVEIERMMNESKDGFYLQN